MRRDVARAVELSNCVDAQPQVLTMNRMFEPELEQWACEAIRTSGRRCAIA